MLYGRHDNNPFIQSYFLLGQSVEVLWDINIFWSGLDLFRV